MFKIDYVVPHQQIRWCQKRSNGTAVVWWTSSWNGSCSTIPSFVCVNLFLAYIVFDTISTRFLHPSASLCMCAISYFVNKTNEKNMLIWICFDLPIDAAKQNKRKKNDERMLNHHILWKMCACKLKLAQSCEMNRKKKSAPILSGAESSGPMCIRLSSYAFSHFI